MTRVAAERIALNSDEGILRGFWRTAASTKYKPLSPSPTVGAAQSSPRPPPERAKIAAEARAYSATNRHRRYSKIEPTPSELSEHHKRAAEHTSMQRNNIKGAAEHTSLPSNGKRTEQRSRKTKGGKRPGRKEMGDTATERRCFRD